MKKKLKIKIAIIILLIISALVLFFTGTYDYLKIKVINYFENTVNRTGLELIKGTGSLIDKAALGSLEDSGIKGEEYNFNNIDNPYYAISQVNMYVDATITLIAEGDTFKIKDVLKEYGFYFVSEKKIWSKDGSESKIKR